MAHRAQYWPCGVGDCSNPAHKAGLCWAHAKQRQQGKTLRAIVPKHASPWERLTEAALNYADSDAADDAAWDAARNRLRMAAVHYVESLPKTRADGRDCQATCFRPMGGQAPTGRDR